MRGSLLQCSSTSTEKTFILKVGNYFISPELSKKLKGKNFDKDGNHIQEIYFKMLFVYEACKSATKHTQKSIC